MIGCPLACQPLYGGAGVEPQPEVAAQLVEHVAYADVLGLPEYAVPAFGVGDDLGVPAGCVEEHRVRAARERPAYLDVRDAVVHADDRHPERAGEGPRGRGGHPQAGPQAGTHGERYEAYVGGVDARGIQRGRYRVRGDLRVVVGRLPRMQTALGGTEHVDLVGQDPAVGVHDPHAECVRRPLYAQCQHLLGLVWGPHLYCYPRTGTYRQTIPIYECIFA